MENLFYHDTIICTWPLLIANREPGFHIFMNPEIILVAKKTTHRRD
jgi:hypothetical protein